MSSFHQHDQRRGYRWIVLALLVSTYIFSYLDRQILGILAEPIKRDLGLSDTALGFLGGTTFALFYATLGIPIARLADRHPRRTVLTLSLMLWSGLTALTSMVGSFSQLLLMRIGVAVGEAGCNPSASSLIADYFPVGLRGTAMAVYGVGIPIGIGLGMLVGGSAGQYLGWRAAFLVVGLPGLLFSIVLWLVLREPKRGLSDEAKQRSDDGETASALSVVKYMLSLRSFTNMTFAVGLLGTSVIAGAMWNPAYLMRSHHMALAEVGSTLAIIMIGCGALGTVIGGFVTDRLGRTSARAQLLFPMLTSIAACPVAFLAYSATDGSVALGLLALLVFLLNLPYSSTASLTLRLAPLRGRSLATGMSLLVTNFIAAGLGAQVVGIVSDMLRPHWGNEALSHALSGSSSLFLGWAALHYFLASRSIDGDVLKREEREAVFALGKG